MDWDKVLDSAGNLFEIGRLRDLMMRIYEFEHLDRCIWQLKVDKFEVQFLTTSSR